MSATPQKFFDALVPGNLVAAVVLSSSKLHLVRIVRRVTADMCVGNPDAKKLSQMFDAKPLCEVRPRYWWTPVDQLESWKADDKCRWCFAKWRADGRPTITGWASAEAPVVSSVRLPWGWHEVTVQGHPLDLPADGPDPDPDEDEKDVGSKRVEIRRWIRGHRYVRITQDLKDQRFCVRTGMHDDASKAETWIVKGGWETALLRSVTLMALGGMTNMSINKSKLTMRDVVAENR